MKRVKRHIKSPPNPLFEQWLKEWKEEAHKNGSEMYYIFAKALKSLQKFPFKLKSGNECCILESFGPKLCKMIDKKLSEHLSVQAVGKQNVDSIANTCIATQKQDSPSAVSDIVNKRKNFMNSPLRPLKCSREKNDTCVINRGRKKNSPYLPTYRSGAYAILLTLQNNSEAMSKAELEDQAQDLCDASFKKTADSYYTAWSSMSTLIKKGLVEKINGKPVRFSLTASGIDTAMTLKSLNARMADTSSSQSECHTGEKPFNHFDNFNGEQYNFKLSVSKNESDRLFISKKYTSIETTSARVDNLTQFEKFDTITEESKLKNPDVEKIEETTFLLPNRFNIVLYVDNNEIENSQEVENDKVIRYLRRRNINCEVKHLNVGDYLWVCRDLRSNFELVLPYIVERKRMDDLAKSIRDGRFHEQKFRLKHCGITNVIYLVEKFGNDGCRLGLPLPTIQQAISNTRIIDGFCVKISADHNDSLSYLSSMTSFLTRIFIDKTLMSCRKVDLPPFNISNDMVSLMVFSEFNKDSGKMKKFTVRNMLVKQLIQLSGISVEKANAIVKVYPTPKSLIHALRHQEGEAVIANITCGALNRSVGSAAAKSIYQLFTLSELN